MFFPKTTSNRDSFVSKKREVRETLKKNLEQGGHNSIKMGREVYTWRRNKNFNQHIDPPPSHWTKIKIVPKRRKGVKKRSTNSPADRDGNQSLTDSSLRPSSLSESHEQRIWKRDSGGRDIMVHRVYMTGKRQLHVPLSDARFGQAVLKRILVFFNV